MSQATQRTNRGIAIVLVGAVHILIFEQLIGILQTRQPAMADESAVSMLFFVTTPTQQPQPRIRANPRKPSSAPRRVSSGAGADPALPITMTPAAAAPVAVDWAKEAERVAAHRIEADEGLRRSASIVSPPPAPFRWDYAHIHRIEAIPDGGLILNLSDRCALVFKFPMFLGGCKIGEIESRSDLFAHMRDPR